MEIKSIRDLSLDQIGVKILIALMKRMIISQINGCDPMNLAAPYTLRTKILMTKMWYAALGF